VCTLQNVGDGRDEMVALLRQARLFAELPEAALMRLAAGAILRRLQAGEWLFRMGDDGDQLFVVATGRLEVVLESPPPARVARLLDRGEVVGEVALVSGQPRSASVRARRDTEVLEISSTGFRDLLRQHTDVALGLLQVLARRLASGAPPSGFTPRTVAVVDVREQSGRTMLSSLADAFGGNVARVDRAGQLSDVEPGRHLDDLEKRYDVVLLTAHVGDPSEWVEFCRRQADRVIVVGDIEDLPPVAELAGLLNGCDLALVGRPSSATGRWLEALHPRAHHWLDLPDRSSGVARLVRRLTGRSTGVVLSGGGTRGFAHIGAVERLRERGLSIDRIGGCSMGAFVAGLVALGLSAEDCLDLCRREFVSRNPFNDYTLPRVSLIRARKAAAMLQRVFGDGMIEDCSADYFCVSSDLVGADLVVHRRGPLWQAIGASMSIPGFAPPVELEGRLLVDGGVLDNLPVEVMAATGEGPVVAVDAMGRTQLGQPGVQPTLRETLFRATVLGSWQRLAEKAERARLVITPDIPPIGLLEFHRIDEVVDAGRRAVDLAFESGLL
jgi:NTE family protein